MNKYGNQRCVVDGIAFDSKKEARRYGTLKMMEKAGVINNLQRQVRYPLLPTQYESFERYGNGGKRLKDGRRVAEQGVFYVADFVYEENGKTVVEDTKGMKTKDYILKRKMMLYFHGIRVREV